MKITPGFTDILFSPVTGRLWSIFQFPDLSTGKIWIGDENNRPIESSFSPLGSYLPFNQIFRGNEDNVATPYPTILLQNLPNLGVATITGLDLPAGKIWRGTDTNRPEESDALSFMEADILAINSRFFFGHFVMNSGNALIRLFMPNSQYLEDLVGLPGIAKVNLGGFITLAVAGVDYITPTQLEDAIAVLQDEIEAIQNEITAIEAQLAEIITTISIMQTQIDGILAELAVITGEIDAIQAELVVINSEITDLQAQVAALEIAVDGLTDAVAAIEAEIVVINGEIDAIQAELVVITADIATLQAQVATIFAQLITIESEIAALAAAIAAISIDIDIVFGDIDELQAEIDDLQNQIDDLRDTIISMEARITSNYDQMIYITNILFADVQDLQQQIDNLRLNNIPADGDVSIYNNRLIDVQDPINPQDAATMGWTEALVSDIPSTTTVTLEGDVSGSGTIDAPIETTLNLTLDEIPTAVNDVDIGGNKLTNVDPGVSGTDAVNKNQLTDAISSLDVTLEGFIEGGPAVAGVIETTRGPDCLLTNIPAGGDVDMGNYEINNLSMNTNFQPLDAANAQLIWNVLNGDVDVEWAA